MNRWCAKRVTQDLDDPVNFQLDFQFSIDEVIMAKNRMTFEKHQRDANKKRKADEKRALKAKKREDKAQSESEPDVELPSTDESAEDDNAV